MTLLTPSNYNPPFNTPIRDWIVVLRPGWGDELPRNLYGQVMSVAWRRLKEVGLCGKVASDGSDVWDAGNATNRHR